MTALDDLKKPLSDLSSNTEFIRQSQKMGINTLQDMMQADLVRIKQHKDFSHTWYADMLSLLKEQDLLSQFQEKHL